MEASSCGAGDLASVFRKQPVGMREGTAWQPDPGEQRTSSVPTAFLYFGADGEFDIFSGVVLKRVKTLSLREREGERVSSGTWKANGETVQVEYRLISLYKVMVSESQRPPAAPGTTEHAEARLDGHARHLPRENHTYQPIAGFKIPELREHLRIHQEQPLDEWF